MPFDWYESQIPDAFKEKISDRFEEVYLEEVRFRARLFFNLGYPSEYAVHRIKENLQWEFELSTVPDFIERIEEEVKAVYKHYGSV